MLSDRLLLALGAAACAMLSACAPPPRGPAPARDRVFAADAGRFVPWSQMLDRLAGADVVFVGEQHDDSAGHRIERRLAEELGTRRPLVVAMEMFERDVQPLVDRYLAGSATEEELLAGSRPWGNYAADYRPVVELARGRGWPVVASNVPRRLAGAVARGGLDTLRALPAEERALAAAEIECPEDEYYRRFVAEMGEHPGMSPEVVKRTYLAQCVKDETMAQSIAEHLRDGSVTLHLNGAFHSDGRLGIVPRLERRRPGIRIAVVSLVPARGPRRGEPAPGDFVIYTR